MKTESARASTPVRRDLTDSRSTGAPSPQARKTLLNDRRSTR